MANSLPPIPSRILKTAATLKVVSGVDFYQNQTYTEYALKRVHLQPTNQVAKTQSNTTCNLRAILFVDARISTPSLDWLSLLQTAHDNKGDMRVIVRGVEYTVDSVDELWDDTDNLHHWEVGLI